MSSHVLTHDQQQILNDMMSNCNLSILLPVGCGKKVIVSHFLMHLQTLLGDIYETLSVVIVIESMMDKNEWMRALSMFKNIRESLDVYPGELNIHILKAYRLPQNIQCDFFITDISSFRLLKGKTIVSMNKFLLVFSHLIRHQVDIIRGIFGCEFVVSDRLTPAMLQRMI